MRQVNILMTLMNYSLYEEKAFSQEIHLYQCKVGSILYAAIITRPDIARTASKLSEFLQNPSPRHHAAVDQAITYLYGTKTLAIEFSADTDEQEVFIGASDASYADDKPTCKSSEGYLFKLFDGAIDWHAMKQKTVTISSTEAKFLALSHTAKEIYWWKCLFRCIQMDPDHDTAVACDNQQTICLLTEDTGKFSTKLCHVDIHRH